MSSKIIEATKRIDWRDVVSRALWTFVQAFLAVVLLVSDQIVNALFAGDWQALKGLIIATMVGGLAAGVSAVKTILISVIKDIRTQAE